MKNTSPSEKRVSVSNEKKQRGNNVSPKLMSNNDALKIKKLIKPDPRFPVVIQNMSLMYYFVREARATGEEDIIIIIRRNCRLT